MGHDETHERRHPLDATSIECALLDAMPQLAWLADADGSIRFYNRGWYAYTGTTFEQMEGWGWRSVHDPALLPAVEARWRASIETGAKFKMPFPLRRHDGVFRWFLTRVNPQLDASGKVARWIGINTDIDEQRQNAHELALALESELAAKQAAEALAAELVTQSQQVKLALERATQRIGELEERLRSR